MDTLYLQYCHTSQPFYDRPRAAPGSTLFDAHRDGLPARWQRRTTEEWVYYQPVGATLRPQGWKVHVSATPDTAEQVLSATAAYCLGAGVPFKALRDRDTVVRRNSKYADRGASGKFVTAYPADDAELETIVRALHEKVGGLPGPYILSDLRWAQGPVFVRYGAFVSRQTIGPGGRTLECIEDPQGNLVEDERRPAFHPPPWAPVPAFLRPALQARAAGRFRDFPYRVEAALHFSNGGGVYRALRLRDGATILLKEARPHCGLDGAGRDAVHRLDREHAALRALACIPGIPTVDAYVQGVEHTFLGREFVEGRPLHDVVEERNPLTNPASGWARADYARWATSTVKRIRELLDRVHAAGWVFGDLHPGNILLTADDEPYLIDFEASSTDLAGHVQTLGALGYRAPEGCRGVAVDEYAMAWLRVGVLLPFTRLASVTRDGLDRLLEDAAEQFAPQPDHFAGLHGELGVQPPAPGKQDRPRTEGDEWLEGAASRLWTFDRHATPQRTDRLYPGDVAAFLQPGGGLTFAHGAAGVIWTQRLLNLPVDPAHVRWLRDGVAREASALPPGFWHGLAGIAYAVAGLDDDLADTCLRAARTAGSAEPSLNGLSGLGLLALHPGARLSSLAEGAGLDVEQLGSQLRAAMPTPSQVPPGLIGGASGAAIFATRLWLRSGDAAYLRLARELVAAEVERYHLAPARELVRATTPCRGAGLAGGALGAGLALHELHQACGEEDLAGPLARVRTEVATGLAMHAGVLSGCAGQIQYLLATEPDGAVPEDVIAAHRRHLGRFIDEVDGSVLSLGDACLKFSLDFGTGLAGVLATLEGVRRGIPTLGLLSPDPLESPCHMG